MRHLMTYVDLERALLWLEQKLAPQESSLAALIREELPQMVRATTGCTYRDDPDELHQFNLGAKINLGLTGRFLVDRAATMESPLLLISPYAGESTTPSPSLLGGVDFIQCGRRFYGMMALKDKTGDEVEDFLLHVSGSDGTVGMICDAGDEPLGTGVISPESLTALTRSAPHVIISAYNKEDWLIFDKRIPA